MTDDLISDMSEEKLFQYANAEQITITVSYIKTDAEGNRFYVSEDEALTKAEAFKTALLQSEISPLASGGGRSLLKILI